MLADELAAGNDRLAGKKLVIWQFAAREIASWMPPTPKKLIDPRPNVSLAAKTADIFVTKDGLIYASDWNAGLNVLQYEG